MTSYDALARFYDLEHAAFEADLNLYLEFARRCGEPVLDLGCGSGRVLAPLAAAGFRVVGVDCSAAMLARARAALPAETADRVELVQADLRELALSQRFPLAVFALDGLLHLPTLRDQERALRRIAGHLTPGGLLVIDAWSPSPAELAAADGQVVLGWSGQDEAGCAIQKFVTRFADPASQTLELAISYDQVDHDGILRRTGERLLLRYLHRYELELLLERVGLAVEQVYGSYDLEPYTAASERLIVVATKGEA